MLNLSNKKILNHLLFWVIFSFAAFIIDPPRGGPLVIKIIGALLIVLSYAFIYYADLYFIFPRFYEKKLHLLLAIIVLVFALFMFIEFLILDKFLGPYSRATLPFGSKWTSMIIPNFLMFSFISMPALGAYQNKIGIEKLKLKGEKEKKLRLKELEFLRNQFNSHITFDFLNRCHDLVHTESLETSKAIEIFSRMLRYSLNSKAQEKVLLNGEIEYLQDFIKLQKLLSTDVRINLSVKGNDSIYILPRILIGFVENAFKHGDLHSVDHPISIELNATTEYLDFTVTNKKNKHKIIEASGIGNFNLKQQLELLYKNKYTLKIDDTDSIYSSSLRLKLN
jgi:two-component system LytT family sensor kinase